MSVKHILFIVTNTHDIGPRKRKTGCFFPEIAHPVDVFEERGIAIEHVSPLGGAVSDDGYDEKDPAQLAYRNALTAEGAQFSSAEPWQSTVVSDGRLMTVQNPASAGPLAKEIVKALG